MQKITIRFGNILAAAALVVTGLVANSTCGFILHQPVLPAKAKELRKF